MGKSHEFQMEPSRINVSRENKDIKKPIGLGYLENGQQILKKASNIRNPNKFLFFIS